MPAFCDWRAALVQADALVVKVTPHFGQNT
jgi:hypothetical protein